MSVFEYRVHLKEREDSVETGTVIAKNEKDARKKLMAYDLRDPTLKEIKGFSGIFKKFTANIK